MKKTFLLLAVLTFTMLASAQQRGEMHLRLQGGPESMPPLPPLRGFGGTWWRDSELATKLKLADQQKQQLEKTFLDYRLKLVDLRAEVERQELKLQPLIDADQVNDGQISTALNALIAARGKLELTNAMMNISMRQVLTIEQWKQLRSLQAERIREMRGPREPHGMRRPAGMMPPPEGPAEPPAAPDKPTPPPGDTQ